MKTYTKTIEEPRLKIQQDTDAQSPRKDGCNLGYFITCESRYSSPDRDTAETDDIETIIETTSQTAKNAEDHMKMITEDINDEVLYITPVYRYEHGNVTYRRGVQHGFDSSNCGFYIITKNTLAKVSDLKKIGMEEMAEIESQIDEELEAYTKYANGEVYEFTLYDEDDVGDSGVSADMCGGFYDIEDIKEALPDEWKDEDLTEYLI